MKRPSALVPVIAGFGVMLILLAAVTAIGVTHVRTLSGQLTAIVAERNEKAELATAMQAVHEARYQSLLLASNLADPFARDEEIMHFRHLAREFIAARSKFLALPLTGEERRLWGRIREEVRGVELGAEQVLAHLQEGRLDAAREQIRQRLHPAQQRMMDLWARLVTMQRALNRGALAEARAASRRAGGLTLGLSASACAVGLIVAMFVVRRSRDLENALLEEQERAQLTLQAIGDAVIRFDEARRIAYLNPAAEQLLGATGTTAVGRELETVMHLLDKEQRHDLTPSLVAEAMAGRKTPLPSTATLLSKPGIEQDVEGSYTPIPGTGGRIVGGVLVMRDVTEAREMHRKLLWQAHHDALTGLVNRPALVDKLTQGLVSKRATEQPLALLYIDLDRFKPVNDTAGHAAGDEMLRQVAMLARSRIRHSDTLARVGGDEFAILLNACSKEKALRIAETIQSDIGALCAHGEGQACRLHASIGLLHVTPQWVGAEECLAAARAACDEAKREGGGKVVAYQADTARPPTANT
ncbi:MAG: diguanylate cyclase [Pseudomonadota bacterium]